MWVVVKNTLPIPSFPSSCQSQIVHSSLFVCAGVNIHLEEKKIYLHAFILKYMSNLCEFVIAAHEKDPRTL